MYDCSADTGLFCQLTNVGKSDSSLVGHISLWCSWLWRCLIAFNDYCKKDTASTDAGRTMLCSLSLSFCRFCPIMSTEAWIPSCEVPSLRITAPDHLPVNCCGSPPGYQSQCILKTVHSQCWKIFPVPARKHSTLYISHRAWIVMSSANALLELLRLFCGCWAKFCVDAIGSLEAEVRLSF